MTMADVPLGLVVIPNGPTFSIFTDDENLYLQQKIVILYLITPKPPSLTSEPLRWTNPCIDMLFWSWGFTKFWIRNIRGLVDLDKRVNVQDFIYLFGFYIVALQETKLCSPTFHFLRFTGGGWINEWVLFNSIGASGGQLIGWNGNFLRKSVNFQLVSLSRLNSRKGLHNPHFVSLPCMGPMIKHLDIFSFMTSTLHILGIRQSLGLWKGLQYD